MLSMTREIGFSHLVNENGFSPSIAIGPDDRPTIFYTNFLRSVCYLTMGDVPEPTTPSEPDSFDVSGCEGMASLSWEPPGNDGGSDITSYEIYRSKTPGGAK